MCKELVCGRGSLAHLPFLSNRIFDQHAQRTRTNFNPQYWLAFVSYGLVLCISSSSSSSCIAVDMANAILLSSQMPTAMPLADATAMYGKCQLTWQLPYMVVCARAIAYGHRRPCRGGLTHIISKKAKPRPAPPRPRPAPPPPPSRSKIGSC